MRTAPGAEPDVECETGNSFVTSVGENEGRKARGILGVEVSDLVPE